MSEQSGTLTVRIPGQHDSQSTEDRVLDLLAELGTTAEQIAAGLHERGIRGERKMCDACPITVYLLHSDLGCSAVDTSDSEIALWFGGRRADDVVYVDTPEPVARFIEEFDAGSYPRIETTWGRTEVDAAS